MTEPKEFAWRCVILDDQPAGNAGMICGALTKLGLQCVLGPPEDPERPPMASLGEHLARDLIAADVVLIDMKWDKVGRNGADNEAVAILREGIDGLLGFKAWCEAYAYAQVPDTSAAGDDQVGYVLGAAISQLNSHARLIFVSSVAENNWNPIVNSLQLFKPAPYEISVKNPDRTIGAVMKALGGLQRLLVAQNREVRRWLIAQVLLPVSLGRPPQSGMCAEVWPDRDACETGGDWSLDPKKVLPQFINSDGQWDLTGLVDLLPKRAWRLPTADRQALKRLRHTLVKLCDAPDEMTRDATSLRAQCALAGVAGQRVLIPLELALANPTIAAIDRITTEVDKVGRNDLSALFNLCLKYGGDLYCDPELYILDGFGRPTAEADSVRLPFDLFHLQIAVDALADNHEKLRRGAGRRALSTYVGHKSLTVVYSDDSPGFESKDALADRLKASLEKTDPLDRGLPLALSFPFFYPVLNSAIALSDHSWLDLYGEMQSEWAIKDHADMPFRVAWTFKLTDEKP